MNRPFGRAEMRFVISTFLVMDFRRDSLLVNEWGTIPVINFADNTLVFGPRKEGAATLASPVHSM